MRIPAPAAAPGEGTDYSHAKIAALAGFEHVEYMNVLFKRKTGQTPGELPRQYTPAFPGPCPPMN